MTLEEIRNFEFNHPEIQISLSIYDEKLKCEGCASLCTNGGLAVYAGNHDGSDDYFISPDEPTSVKTICVSDLNNRLFVKSIDDNDDNLLLVVNEYLTA